MISVVLGTCNRLEKLKRSLQSIAVDNPALNQSIEVLVSDGGSTDGTLEFLRSKPYGLDLKFIGEGALHGVTSCYNRLFRMASRPLITWTSDDCRYEPGSLVALVDRINQESEKTLVGCYANNDDGLGYVEYSDQKCCTIGGARRSLYELVDYWSEDFMTYASDVDFSYKILRSGGQVVFEPNAKVFHEMDSKDHLHTVNGSLNIASNRFSFIFNDHNMRRFAETGTTYPDVFLKASSIEELLNVLEQARVKVAWGNFYTLNDFGFKNQLESMNVKVVNDYNPQEYDIVMDQNNIELSFPKPVR